MKNTYLVFIKFRKYDIYFENTWHKERSRMNGFSRLFFLSWSTYYSFNDFFKDTRQLGTCQIRHQLKEQNRHLLNSAPVKFGTYKFCKFGTMVCKLGTWFFKLINQWMMLNINAYRYICIYKVKLFNIILFTHSLRNIVKITCI